MCTTVLLGRFYDHDEAQQVGFTRTSKQYPGIFCSKVICISSTQLGSRMIDRLEGLSAPSGCDL